MADPRTYPERFRTGVPGLDDLLSGGLLAGRTLLIKGAPGSGKTTLGLQMLVAGATDFDQPGVLLTFEQLPDQLTADVSGFGWDLSQLRRDGRLHILFIRPEEVLEGEGRQENRLIAQIDDLVEDHGVRRVMIDSLSHIQPFAATDPKARALLMKFLVRLKMMGLTPIMTAELGDVDATAGLDAYLVDAVFQLRQEIDGLGQPGHRHIEIVKTRGQDHLSGRHPFEIGARGVVIYPHCYPGDSPVPAARRNETVTTGVTALDKLLAGGYTAGSVVLVAGLSGTFKTAVGAHFLIGGDPAEEGAGLWVTFQERSDELEGAFAARGLELAAARESGRLHYLAYGARHQPVEKVLQQVEARVADHGITRVVIDSQNELTAWLPAHGPDRSEAMCWFLARLRALGVTTLVTQRLTEVTGLNPLSEIFCAELADTIIYLGLVEIESRLEKVVSVLKHRGGATEGDLRAIHCDAGAGLRVTERFVGLQGVLAGSPQGRRKQQIEEIFQPLYFLRDLLKMAKDPQLDESRRDELVERLSGETSRLIEVLSRYFDMPARTTGHTHAPAWPDPAGKEDTP